jgi:hypothetical protein
METGSVFQQTFLSLRWFSSRKKITSSFQKNVGVHSKNEMPGFSLLRVCVLSVNAATKLHKRSAGTAEPRPLKLD